MSASNQTLLILVIVSMVLSASVLVLLIATSPARRRAVSKRGRPDLTDVEQSIMRVHQAIDELAQEDVRLAEALEAAIQNIGVVRFDAFEDMGGQLSFSAAFLDGRGDGVVITSINGRQDTRCYSKPVRGGESDHNLSAEEHQAIRRALTSPREAARAL
ncbi:MAG: DUF4446 family protein [Actinomycetota bacterium]